MPPGEMRYLTSQLLEVRGADDFLWLLRWLRKEKNCERAIYEELTQTPAMRKKIEAIKAGARYLTRSQKMSRANDRRRRAVERKKKHTPSGEE